MAADKMKEILKHFPDLEKGWKETEEKLKADPAEREMLSLRERQMFQKEMLKENLPEPEFTKAKRADSDLKVMKANEVPEKIYIFEDELQREDHVVKYGVNQNKGIKGLIEYTRTEAFIEKAVSYLEETLFNEVCYGEIRPDIVQAYINDFRKAMEQ